MTDEELMAVLNEHAGWVSLLGRDHLLGMLKDARDRTRLSTARACAEECEKLAARQYRGEREPYTECASSIRTRFGVK